MLFFIVLLSETFLCFPARHAAQLQHISSRILHASSYFDARSSGLVGVLEVRDQGANLKREKRIFLFFSFLSHHPILVTW